MLILMTSIVMMCSTKCRYGSYS